MTKPLPTAKQRADWALKSARTRAKKHAARGDHAKAFRTMRRGAATAQHWLRGTHPHYDRCSG